MDMIIVFPTIVAVIYGIIKNVSAPAVLFIAGMVLLSAAAIMGISPVLPIEKSTGLAVFDLFEKMRAIFSFRTAGLGLSIMTCGGFATYMSHIGASEALVRFAVKPISKIKSAYIVLALCYILVVMLQMFVTSATGFGLLLMVTLFPVLRNIGLSPASAVAIIASAAAFEIGVTQVNTNFAAAQSGLDIADYFLNYQAVVTIPMVLFAAFLHMVWQRRCDLKMGWHAHEHVGDTPETEEQNSTKNKKDQEQAPAIYAFLPLLPFLLLLVFSKLMISTVSINLVVAMLAAVFFGMICELIRHRDVQTTTAGFDEFLSGMGVMFGSVVGLIIAAEMFAQGLKQIGAIDTLLASAQFFGVGADAMMLVMVGLIIAAALIMGSGNAAFLSFATLVPDIAKKYSMPAVLMLLPMNFAASIGRSMSPISAVIIATSGMAKISPFDVVKRTVVPMVGALLLGIVLTLILF